MYNTNMNKFDRNGILRWHPKATFTEVEILPNIYHITVDYNTSPLYSRMVSIFIVYRDPESGTESTIYCPGATEGINASAKNHLYGVKSSATSKIKTRLKTIERLRASIAAKEKEILVLGGIVEAVEKKKAKKA